MRQTKTCRKCKEPKSSVSFNKGNGAGNKHSVCINCSKEENKEWYRNNKAKHLHHCIERKKRLHERNAEMKRQYCLDHPCIDCGEKDSVVIDFDHRDPKLKLYTVSVKLGNRKWESVLDEIKKCDSRCANCHRRRTAVQFGWTISGRTAMSVSVSG